MPESNHTTKLRGQGRRTHGFNVGGKRTPELAAINRIVQRCTNPNHHKFASYGERGIRVCDRYRHSPAAFVADIGLRPTPQHSVNRKDNDGNYSCGKCEECLANGWPMNVEWATPPEQSRNMRSNHYITFNGETLCLTDWSRRLGILECTLIVRLRRWSLERALTEPRHNTR